MEAIKATTTRARLDENNMLVRAMQGISECVHITDLEGVVLYVNDAFLKTYGYEREEILGKNIEVVYPIMRSPVRTAEILPVTFRSEWQGELLNCRKDGSQFLVSLSTSVVCDDAGKPQALICIASDVTRSKEAEQAVRDSEQRYRITLQSISDAVMIVNDEGIIETVNDAAMTKYCSRKSGLVVGTHLSELFALPVAQRRLDIIGEVIRTKSSIQIEERLDAPDGRIWVLTKFNPLLDMHGACTKVVIVSRDFTAEKEREEYLRYFSRNVLHAQEEERRRIARELHDGLARALTALRLDLFRIQDGLSSGVAGVRAKIQHALATVALLLEEARRIAINLTPPLLEDMGLPSAIRKLATELSQQCGIKTAIDLSGFAGQFSADQEIHIYRILQEIFSNISHHAHAKNVRLTCTEVDRRIKFTVQDDGVGFEPERALSSSAAKEHLGLRGLQERARLLNGRLEIHSVPGGGTTMALLIPRSTCNEGGRSDLRIRNVRTNTGSDSGSTCGTP